MKMEVNVKYKPIKRDVIIWDGNQWINANLDDLLKPLNDRIQSLEDEIKIIKGVK